MSKFYNGIFSLILIFASFNFISCDEKNKPEPVLPVQQVQKPEEPVEKTQPAEIPPVEQTITPKTEEKPSENDAEYLRSINNLTDTESVSKEEFSEDKKEILRIISELSEIMEKQDISEWLNYIEPTSKEYYSNPLNVYYHLIYYYYKFVLQYFSSQEKNNYQINKYLQDEPQIQLLY